jgi:hypothetical protein
MAAAGRIAVIGGGIVGLSAALALQDAGAAVRVFEKGEPGRAQSVGLARIFRLGHGNPALVSLAMRAYDGWHTWERRFGRQLVGQEGMLVTGEATLEQYGRALGAAGAPYRILEAAEASTLLPIGRFPQSRLLVDVRAGSIRARRTIETLCAALTAPVEQAEVREIRITASGAQIATETTAWECDGVLIAAGLDTPGLAAKVGLEIPGEPWQILRFTFEQREPRSRQPLACWIDDSRAYGDDLTAYALPIGTTDAAAAQAGVPALYAEAGGIGQLRESDVALLLRGLHRVLVQSGMVGGTLQELPPPAMLREVRTIRAAGGGFFRREIAAGDAVAEGGRLGTMTDLWGEPLSAILSPVGGTALFVTTSPAISPDGILAGVGVPA